MVAPSTIGIDDDIQDFEDYTIDDQDKYQVPRKNVSILFTDIGEQCVKHGWFLVLYPDLQTRWDVWHTTNAIADHHQRIIG